MSKKQIKTTELADTYLHCRIKKSTKAKLKELAEKNGESMSKYIERLIFQQRL